MELPITQIDYSRDGVRLQSLSTWSHVSVRGRPLRAWFKCCKAIDFDPEFANPEEELHAKTALLRTMNFTVQGRKVITGQHQDAFIAPDPAEPGDKICLLSGCELPIALRELEGGFFKVIGGCKYSRLTS